METNDAVCNIGIYADDTTLNSKWNRGVMVVTTAQLHSTKPELKFCAGSVACQRFAMLRISDSGPSWK